MNRYHTPEKIEETPSCDRSVSSVRSRLREYRKRHERREHDIRNRMHLIASSYSHTSDSMSVYSLGSIETVETSLLSHCRNLTSGRDLKWEKLPLHFYFGFLTSSADAPMCGSYETGDDIAPSFLLDGVMRKAKELSKAIIENNEGNIVMKCHTPYVKHIHRDQTYRPKNRPGIVRSIVQAVVPIRLSDVEDKINSTSKLMAKIMVRQALIEGVRNGLF